jgi:hypothetical protein
LGSQLVAYRLPGTWLCDGLSAFNSQPSTLNHRVYDAAEKQSRMLSGLRKSLGVA